ncbi:hypothetical protein [Phytobacter ursingii]|uniref:hypothetical protein n=1 Tax=Enterobacteriaceae TaxID=543 RepID=UPI001CC73236|nr:hypothetical protein [Phytobacter ursingii]
MKAADRLHIGQLRNQRKTAGLAQQQGVTSPVGKQCLLRAERLNDNPPCRQQFRQRTQQRLSVRAV